MFNRSKKVLAQILMATIFLAMGCCLSMANGNNTPGQIIEFGKWEGEALRWIVLDIRDGRMMLLLAERRLEMMPFNAERGEVTWENCTLRKWLNNDFHKAAFTDDERGRILEVTVPAEKNPKYDTDPGNDTTDKLFLLSVSEYERLLPEKTMRVFVHRGKTQGAIWSLRTPGRTQERTTVVTQFGKLDGVTEGYGDGVHWKHALRPALWIKP